MIRQSLSAALLVLGIQAALAQQPADPSPATTGASALEAMPLEAGTDALSSTADDRLSLQIRIPTEGPALVVDERELALLAGRNQIRIRDLPETLRDLGLHWRLDGAAAPERLTRTRPEATTWQGELFVEAGGTRRLTLTYPVDGLEPGLDYRITLPADDPQAPAEVAAAITLNNRSGADLGGARLSVARAGGAVSRLEADARWPTGSLLRIQTAPPARVAVNRSLITEARGDLPVEASWQPAVRHLVALEGFENPPAVDTPATLVVAGSPPRPVGEGRFATAPDGTPAVIGGSSDAVSVRRVQAAYRDTGDRGIDIAWRIELHNRDTASQRMTLVERIDGGWRIEDGEADWQRTPTGLTRSLELAAGERREVGYRIRLVR